MHISCEQSKNSEANNTFEYEGSSGNLDISYPSFVSVPSVVIAPSR